MKVLVTGHDGYIGTVLTPLLRDAGHDVVGLDSFIFESCTFGEEPTTVPSLRLDIRDVQATDLEGFEAVLHLAALSNDPLGNLDPECTYEINERASVRLAHLAKQAGVRRFLFSSSCSIYGAAGEAMLTEDASFSPVSPYGESKILAEAAISDLADDDFSPTFLRNATAYGVSPRLRMDLVVNDLVGAAYTTGTIVIKSDGTPWRPLVHVEDIAHAFVGILTAPRDLIHNQAFNVGQTSENYQVRDVAEMVRATVPGSTVHYATGGGPDPRCYRVDFGKLARTLPQCQPRWTLPAGIEQLYRSFRRYGLSGSDLHGRYTRLVHLRSLLDSGRLDASLRRQPTRSVSKV
jgi:nucleoside-diphosphate-sugar epimerase